MAPVMGRNRRIQGPTIDMLLNLDLSSRLWVRDRDSSLWPLGGT
ncbi:hypothetical protein CCACVL1_16731 [Corchorus capsularis]|uniref:Uncharacterized protein n=1 Tax=Corchorus capsularis TaxID=210143 RepID=A0A1R3HVW9_COCAP|nr:hypothetical protein CCACVL1_16731 [Corchorus capsularis]